MRHFLQSVATISALSIIACTPIFLSAYSERVLGAGEDYRDAIADSKQVLQINPNDALAYLNQGVARFLLEDKEGAIADLQKAADLFQQQGKTQDYQKTIEILTTLK